MFSLKKPWSSDADVAVIEFAGQVSWIDLDIQGEITHLNVMHVNKIYEEQGHGGRVVTVIDMDNGEWFRVAANHDDVVDIAKGAMQTLPLECFEHYQRDRGY